MNSHDDDCIERTEDELRRALKAAAGNVDPSTVTMGAATAENRVSHRRGAARRWLVPAAAAAAVAAVAIAGGAVAMHGSPGTNAAAPGGAQDTGDTSSGGTGGQHTGGTPAAGANGWVTELGISFPLPHGWSAKILARTTSSETVCLAAEPAADCDGLTAHIAIPDASGDITPLRMPLTRHDAAVYQYPGTPWNDDAPSTSATAPPTTSTATPMSEPPAGRTDHQDGGHSDPPADASTVGHSSTVADVESSEVIPTTPGATPSGPPLSATCVELVNSDPIDGRPAQHMTFGPCGSDPQQLTWFVTDGSLAVTVAAGPIAAQAEGVVAGINFDGYAHDFGPVIASATSAAPSSVSTAAPLTTAAPSTASMTSSSSTVTVHGSTEATQTR